MSELDARSSLGFLFGTDSRSTRGLLWESVELLLKHDFLAARVVHAPSITYTAVHGDLTGKTVPVHFTPRLVATATIGRVAKWDAPARVVRSSTTGRAIIGSYTAKVVPGERIARGVKEARTASVVAAAGVGKAIHSPQVPKQVM